MVCTVVKVGGVRAIVCGPRLPKRLCACGEAATLLCDWKIKGKRSGTCDRPICQACATEVGPNRHVCPEHKPNYEEWLASRRGTNPDGR